MQGFTSLCDSIFRTTTWRRTPTVLFGLAITALSSRFCSGKQGSVPLAQVGAGQGVVSAQKRIDPTELRPLSVAFEMIDEGTVGTVYGKRISRDFFVIRAAFSNNLGRSQVDVSALAYGDTLYVRVRLEKRAGQALHENQRPSPGAWTVATPADFGGAVIDDTRAFPELTPQSEPPGKSPAPLPDSFRIQPYSFSDMIKEAFDLKKGRLTDAQIQNITLQTLRPVEELPYGETIERTLFFPRRPFLRPGKDYVFRISEIYTGIFHTMMPVVHNRNRALPFPQK